jgi:hypothetical protein
MIAFSSLVFDIQGYLVLKKETQGGSNTNASRRRVSRSKILDGDAFITDNGFSDGDRDLRVRVKEVTKDQVDRARYLHQTYSLLKISFVEGSFHGVIEGFDFEDGELKLDVLLKEKLT